MYRIHLSRSLIELHHGTIEAENNEDKPGSRFIIRLPLGKEHLSAEEIDNNPAENSSPIHITTALPTSPVDEEDEKVRSRTKSRVLVVEDDEEIRKYICRELATDFHMSECTNGKEALAIILKKEPDLIISDIISTFKFGLPRLSLITFITLSSSLSSGDWTFSFFNFCSSSDCH